VSSPFFPTVSLSNYLSPISLSLCHNSQSTIIITDSQQPPITQLTSASIITNSSPITTIITTSPIQYQSTMAAPLPQFNNLQSIQSQNLQSTITIPLKSQQSRFHRATRPEPSSEFQLTHHRRRSTNA
jgi:hypothetical protein